MRSLLQRTGVSGSIFAIGCATNPPPQPPLSSSAVTLAATVPATVSPPVVAPQYPTRVFFGDTHLHTAASLDAGTAGTRLLPADAYRFAKGQEVTSASGQHAKLSRALDFLVVSDHSDQMGFGSDLLAGKPELLANPQAKKWYDLIQAGKQQA